VLKIMRCCRPLVVCCCTGLYLLHSQQSLYISMLKSLLYLLCDADDRQQEQRQQLRSCGGSAGHATAAQQQPRSLTQHSSTWKVGCIKAKYSQGGAT
jgi:hypothetical protein